MSRGTLGLQHLKSVIQAPFDRVLYSTNLSGRRSPRLRHGIRRPRPSSAELTSELKDMSEGEDVFYTYRASVSSSKDSEGDASLHQLVSDKKQKKSLSASLDRVDFV